jgi:transposase
MLVAWRQLREQVVAFDKAIRALVRSNSACRLIMSVPGVGVLSALVYVSTVEDPARFDHDPQARTSLSRRDNINRAGSIAVAGYRSGAIRSRAL